MSRSFGGKRYCSRTAVEGEDVQSHSSCRSTSSSSLLLGEYGHHQKQYEALAAELAEEGVLVRVVPAVEALGMPTDPIENAAESYDLAIQVGAFAGAGCQAAAWY